MLILLQRSHWYKVTDEQDEEDKEWGQTTLFHCQNVPNWKRVCTLVKIKK